MAQLSPINHDKNKKRSNSVGYVTHMQKYRSGDHHDSINSNSHNSTNGVYNNNRRYSRTGDEENLIFTSPGFGDTDESQARRQTYKRKNKKQRQNNSSSSVILFYFFYF